MYNLNGYRDYDEWDNADEIYDRYRDEELEIKWEKEREENDLL